MVVGVVLSVGAGIFYLATAAVADNIIETLDANQRYGGPALAMATAGISMVTVSALAPAVDRGRPHPDGA